MAPTSAGAVNPPSRSRPPETISDRRFSRFCLGRKRSSRGRRWCEIVTAAALSAAARASKRLIHAAFSYPIMGRPRADPGEKHEPRVAISSSAENQRLQIDAYQSVTTGAFATPESAVRLLTKAAIEKRPFRPSRCFLASDIRRLDLAGSTSNVKIFIRGRLSNVRPSPTTIMRRSHSRSAMPSSDTAPDEADRVSGWRSLAP